MKDSGFFDFSVPDHLPQRCPECSKKFDRRVSLSKRPAKITQDLERHKGKIIGGCVFGILILLMMSPTGRPNGHFGAVVISSVMIPFLILESLFYLLPEATFLRCRRCGWEMKVKE